MPFADLSPREVKERISSDPSVTLLDVREDWEYEIVRLNGSRLVPMSEFHVHLPSLEKEKNYILYCHHGVRSMQVCNFLLSRGFQNVSNLQGGIERYSIEVDKTLPRY